MREVFDLLGIEPDLQSNVTSDQNTVDESETPLDSKELDQLVQLADQTYSAIIELEQTGTNFSTEIRQLSIAMEQLKAESSSICQKLATRDQALELLAPMKQELLMSSQDIYTIFEGDIDEKWFDSLTRISKMPSGNGESVRSSQRLRTAVITRALERAKTFYITQLRQLRKPGVNAEFVQQDILKNSMVFKLLQQRAPKLFSTLGQAYQNTMKWYYTLLFGKYGRWLNRQPMTTKYTVSLLSNAIKQKTTIFTGQTSVGSADNFGVGARPTVLDDTARPLPMTATTQQSWSLEILVYSGLTALEESFFIESKVAELLHSDVLEVFKPSLEFYTTLFHNWISQCSGDLFGLLLVIRLVQRSPLRTFISDELDDIEAQVWPLIIAICNEQAKGLESAALRASTVASSISKTIAGPHSVTHLVSSYLSGVLQIYPSEPDPQFTRALQSILEAYELFISKLAAGNEKVLHTNYFVMYTLLTDLESELAARFAEHFKLLVDVFSTDLK